MDYDKYTTIENGRIVKTEKRYDNILYNYTVFYEYDSLGRNTKSYGSRSGKEDDKILIGKTVYYKNGYVVSVINYNSYKKNLDTSLLINYYYHNNNQLVKEQMFEYGKITRTVINEYNSNNLKIKEIYYGKNNKIESSYVYVYNELNQIVASYELKKNGKRKKLLVSYEYEY